MKDLFVQKRLIRTLYEKFNLKSIPQTRKRFVEYFSENERGCLLYRFDAAEKYKQRIDTILGGQIPPTPSHDTPREELKEYYLGYDNGSENLLVTRKGTEFISIGGFIQVVGERFNRMWDLLGVVIAFIIGKYWDNITSFFKYIFK